MATEAVEAEASGVDTEVAMGVVTVAAAAAAAAMEDLFLTTCMEASPTT